jgi:H+/gluconate symporter-like permease
MSTAIGIIGILIAFFLVTFLTYKGFHLAYVVIIATLVVLVTSGLPIMDTFSNVVMKGVADQVPTLLPLYLFGAIFGKLFVDSGAAFSLARSLMNIFGAKVSNANTKRLVGACVIIGINMVLNYVGVDPFASLFTMIAIATGILAETNTPRRFLPVLLVIGSNMGNILPGTEAVPNILCMNILQDHNTLAAPIPGIIGVAVVLILSLWRINKLIQKDVEAGLVFEYGPLQPANIDAGHQPPAWLSLIPLIVIPICFNTFAKTAPWAAMAIGVVTALILFTPFLPKKEGQSKIMAIADCLNDGVTIAGIPAIILLNYAIGYAIQASPSFTVITNFFTNIPGPALISLALMGALLLGAAASASGLIIALGVAATVYVPTLGVNVFAAHRVLLASTTVLDSLPFAGAIVAMMSISGIKYKDGYPIIATTAVGFTAVGLAVSTILLVLFPGLA